MRSLMTSRWFALADLACALTAAGLWAAAVSAGIHQPWAWPLIIALTPWGLRLATGKFPFQRSLLDSSLLIFLITAGIGVRVAYGSGPAWNKLWMIVASALVFYALAGQPRSNRWICVGILGVLGAGISFYFLLMQDWNLYPADLGFLNRLGTALMDIRPAVYGPMIQPNIAGGILAMLLPLNIALGIKNWQSGKRISLLVTSGITALIFVGLLMTSSRAAWAALLVGLGIWVWWHLSSNIAQRLKQSHIFTFGLLIVVTALLVLGVLWLRGGSFVQVANYLPGAADAGSRVEITRNTIQLIRDYPFTGGGLASFAHLYSTYIRIILVPEFFYSHNLYLDIALEQGLLGLAAFLVLITATLIILVKYLAARPSMNYLAGACLASLTVVLLHGFLDDALYGMGGTPLILLLPGIIVSLQLQDESITQKLERTALVSRKPILLRSYWLWGGAVVILGIAVFLLKPLHSAWYANMGAVEMSKIKGVIWPSQLSELKTPQTEIDPISRLFEKALQENPNNTTALFRLGILSYYNSDFVKASGYLESAYTQDPNHKGIQKLLGYSYTWTDNLVEAKGLLIKFPEAQEELDSYSWWWGTQNREDLSQLASQMVAELKNK